MIYPENKEPVKPETLPPATGYEPKPEPYQVAEILWPVKIVAKEMERFRGNRSVFLQAIDRLKRDVGFMEASRDPKKLKIDYLRIDDPDKLGIRGINKGHAGGTPQDFVRLVGEYLRELNDMGMLDDVEEVATIPSTKSRAKLYKKFGFKDDPDYEGDLVGKPEEMLKKFLGAYESLGEVKEKTPTQKYIERLKKFRQGARDVAASGPSPVFRKRNTETIEDLILGPSETATVESYMSPTMRSEFQRSRALGDVERMRWALDDLYTEMMSQPGLSRDSRFRSAIDEMDRFLSNTGPETYPYEPISSISERELPENLRRLNQVGDEILRNRALENR